MSYGLLIPNTISLTNPVANLTTVTLLKRYHVSSFNGSATIPEYDSDHGYFYAHSYTSAYLIPRLAWNNTTKKVSWSTGGGWNVNSVYYSNNFDILFFRTDGV